LDVNLKYLPLQRERFSLSSLLERSLEEARRQTKVIGRIPSERSASAMVGRARHLHRRSTRLGT